MRRDAGRVFDEYLVAAARTGDRAALGRLVERWQKRFLSHAYRLTGEAELARDVAQDAWADILKGLPRLQDSAAFPSWGYQIVTRRAADAIRRLQRIRRTNDAAAAEPSIQQTPLDALEHQADANLANGPLGAAMKGLPPDQRAAIALYHLEELSIAEIATALNVPAGTVKTRLMHARKKLRAALEESPSRSDDRVLERSE